MPRKRVPFNTGTPDPTDFFADLDAAYGYVQAPAFDAELQRRTEEWATRHYNAADLSDLF